MPYKNKDGETQVMWKTEIKHYKLMRNAHHESYGEVIYNYAVADGNFLFKFLCFQKFFCIVANDFSSYPCEVSGIRFVLSQPSPCWNTFNLEDIQIYQLADDSSTANPLPE